MLVGLDELGGILRLVQLLHLAPSYQLSVQVAGDLNVVPQDLGGVVAILDQSEVKVEIDNQSEDGIETINQSEVSQTNQNTVEII